MRAIALARACAAASVLASLAGLWKPGLPLVLSACAHGALLYSLDPPAAILHATGAPGVVVHRAERARLTHLGVAAFASMAIVGLLLRLAFHEFEFIALSPPRIAAWAVLLLGVLFYGTNAAARLERGRAARAFLDSLLPRRRAGYQQGTNVIWTVSALLGLSFVHAAAPLFLVLVVVLGPGALRRLDLRAVLAPRQDVLRGALRLSARPYAQLPLVIATLSALQLVLLASLMRPTTHDVVLAVACGVVLVLAARAMSRPNDRPVVPVAAFVILQGSIAYLGLVAHVAELPLARFVRDVVPTLPPEAGPDVMGALSVLLLAGLVLQVLVSRHEHLRLKGTLVEARRSLVMTAACFLGMTALLFVGVYHILGRYLVDAAGASVAAWILGGVGTFVFVGLTRAYQREWRNLRP